MSRSSAQAPVPSPVLLLLLGFSLCAATAAELYRQKLTNVGDAQYTGDLRIGGQNLRGIFDTGSFELIAMSTLCSRCKDHKGHPSFDHKKSSHYEKGTLLVEHVFGSGPVLTQQGFDDIKVGPMAAKNQTIWEITDHKMDVLDEAAFEAIVGIGPGPREMSGEDEAKLDAGVKAIKAAVKSGVLPPVIGDAAVQEAKKPIASISDTSLLDAFKVSRFSICLQPGKGEPGWLTWADEDPRERQGFVDVSVIGKIHWGVELRDVAMKGVSFKIGGGGEGGGERGPLGQQHSLMQRHADAAGSSADDDAAGASLMQLKKKAHGGTVGGRQHHRGTTAIACNDRPCAAVVDSGTSLIAAPTEAMAIIEELVQDLDPNCKNLHKLPNLVFTLGGKSFELPPDAYVGKFVGVIPPNIWDILFFKPPTFQVVSACVPLFMRMDKMTEFGDMWILGMPFFRHYYTTFETEPNRTLYMAKAEDDCTPDTAAVPNAALAQQQRNSGLRAAKTKQTMQAVEARKHHARNEEEVHERRRRPSRHSVIHLDTSKIRLPAWATGTEKHVSF